MIDSESEDVAAAGADAMGTMYHVQADCIWIRATPGGMLIEERKKRLIRLFACRGPRQQNSAGMKPFLMRSLLKDAEVNRAKLASVEASQLTEHGLGPVDVLRATAGCALVYNFGGDHVAIIAAG